MRVHTYARVVGSYGQVGRFYTTIEKDDGSVKTIEHGVTILATGGIEAKTTAYSYGMSKIIVTQKQLEQKIADNSITLDRLDAVVMIQCVDSREEPRNYCSRTCCSSALKHALYLKTQNPDTAVYILYRDMMTYGFEESYFTQARKAGVIFIQYDVERKPRVSAADNSILVTVFEPILEREVQIIADLVVLATGVVPSLTRELVGAFNVNLDRDGFFEAADSKWRPVESVTEGVFACGLANSPRNITESIATAEAAAQRALRILSQKQMLAGKVVAEIRSSLCSLCERCIDVCPYNARTLDIDLEKIVINPVMCQGCGSCASVCPNSAAVISGFLDQQMFDVIDSAVEGMFG